MKEAVGVCKHQWRKMRRLLVKTTRRPRSQTLKNVGGYIYFQNTVVFLQLIDTRNLLFKIRSEI